MTDTTLFQDKKAVYYTLGCKLNFSETSTIARIFKESGIEEAAPAAESTEATAEEGTEAAAEETAAPAEEAPAAEAAETPAA